MIPKIVHHIWTSGNAFDPRWHKFRESWMLCNPEYTFMFWDINSILAAAKELCFLQSSEYLLNSDLFWEGKMDVATWEILYHFGGVKADIDVYCQKNFDELLDCSSFIGKSWEDNLVGVSVVGMEKKNTLAHDIGSEVNGQIIRNWKKKFDPKFYQYTDIFPMPQFLKCERILPREAFFPYSWMDRDEGLKKEWPNSFAVHTWGCYELSSVGWHGIIKNEERRAKNEDKGTARRRRRNRD